MGAVTARRLGWALLALLVGASLGIGAAYATRPEPDASGTPAPIPAARPSVPMEDPYAEDIGYPALVEISDFDTYRIGNDLQDWEYAVPAGWVAYTVPGEVLTPPEDVDLATEVRFRPADEPKEGGFSLRVKAIDNHKQAVDEVIDKVAGFDRAYDDDYDVLDQTEDSVAFTFRTEDDHLRYNFFRWFTAPGANEATLEMSIAGRQVDEPGMRALFEQFAERVVPVDD